HAFRLLPIFLCDSFSFHNLTFFYIPFIAKSRQPAQHQDNNQGNTCRHKACNCCIYLSQQQLTSALNHGDQSNCKNSFSYCLSFSIKPADCYADDQIPDPDKNSGP